LGDETGWIAMRLLKVVNLFKTTAMNFQTSKIELVKRIIEINDPKLVEKLLLALRNPEDDFWNTLSFGEKEEVQEGIKQLDAGQGIPLSEFLKKVS
jgi:hypothetical protein